MRVLGIIPARAGSKRVPNKNIRLLGGKPLVCHAMEAALGSTLLTAIAVSSDSERVLELAGRYPTLLAVPRPAELAADESPAIDYVNQVLQFVRTRGEAPFDAVAIVQPTSPFTLPEDIDATIRLLAGSEADSAVSVMKIPHDLNPLKFKTLAADNRLLPYFEEEQDRMAAHQLPDIYVRNGSVYVSRIATLAGGSIVGRDSRAYVMPKERSLDINEEEDFLWGEYVLEKQHVARENP